MSHFGRSGPPDIRDTYSLLVLNITFRTTADDLYPLFDKYGKVVDVFIPRDRRTGDSRGFAFVRYKYADEAQKAIDKLDGRLLDGREIMVQFAKYGPNTEKIHKGKVMESSSKTKGRSRSRSRSRSPRPRRRDEHRDRDFRRRSRSRSRDRYDRDRHHRSERERRRSRSRSASPIDNKDRRKRSGSPIDYKDRRRISASPIDNKDRKKGSASPIDTKDRKRASASPIDNKDRRVSASPIVDKERGRESASPNDNKDRRRRRYDNERRSRSRSIESVSPIEHSPDTRRSMSPRRTPSRGGSEDVHSPKRDNGSVGKRRADSHSLSPKSDSDE